MATTSLTLAPASESLTLSQYLSKDLRYSLCSKYNLPITFKIIPKWNKDWSKKDTMEKVVKVFKEIIRSIAILSIVIPVITFSVDLIQNIKGEKIYPVTCEAHEEISSCENTLLSSKEEKKKISILPLVILTTAISVIAISIFQAYFSFKPLDMICYPLFSTILIKEMFNPIYQKKDPEQIKEV